MPAGDPQLAAAVADALAGADLRVPGFSEPQGAGRNVRALAGLLEGVEGAAAPVTLLVHGALATPDPDSALNHLEQFLSSCETPAIVARELQSDAAARELLLSICGFSHFLSSVLIRQPDVFPWLINAEILHTPRTLGDYRREVREALAVAGAGDAARDALARLRKREMLRIGARDMLRLADVEETTREISELAQALVAGAADCAWADLVARYGEPTTEPGPPGSPPPHACGMCVLGMGKLGGRELNFSSDIDLIFVYDEEGQTTARLPDGRKGASQTNHAFFTKMGEAIVRFLSSRGPEGVMFRVDMRLRPEGKAGPLARSLDSFLHYLRQQARDWERLAYLKARVLAGPSTLAERIYRFTQEFVFSDVDPAQIVREVQNLKTLIDREVLNSDQYHREVKRGYGGIREIEFVISAMQIIYGRRHRALRARNFFVAVERLREVQLMPPADADFYLEAYAFLRLVEHRLQMAEEAQTHTIPEEPGALERLARRCHLGSAAELMERHRAVTSAVHARFTAFFQHDAGDADRTAGNLMVVLNREVPEEEARAALGRLGIDAPDAVRLLRDLAWGTREIFISAEGQRSFEQMLPSLVRLMRTAPDPARVLPHFHSFMLAIKGITYYYELIAQHPDILNLLVRLFGTSDEFSRSLISNPEFFDALISGRVLYEADLPGQALERMRVAAGAARATDRKMVLLRRAAKFESLLAALRLILGLRDLRDTLADLSAAADAAVETALAVSAERAAERHADPADRRAVRALGAEILEFARAHLAVLALGKYGGGELNFFGDLDLVFVVDDDPPEGPSRIAGRDLLLSVTSGLSYCLTEHLQGGRMYEIDARLRPHGRNAPLTTALGTYVDYLAREAATWELQSFLRARTVAGNPAFLERLSGVAGLRHTALDPAAVRGEILAMRRRLEESVGDEDRAAGELKRSAGGIVDVEFALQYLALAGRLGPAVGERNYFRLLERIEAENLADPAATAALRAGYTELRQAETMARLVRGAAESALPADPAQRRAVAILTGVSPVEELDTRLAAVRAGVRVAFEAILNG